MRNSLEFILGLLERDFPAHAAAEDFAGRHGPALRLWQRMGFLAQEPGSHPSPSCCHCWEGVPYRFRVRYICPRCRSTVPPEHLLLWRFDLESFLSWLAARWRLRGDVTQIDESLWQLGTLDHEGAVAECFYLRGGFVSKPSTSRLSAYRSAIVLYGVTQPPQDPAHVRWLSLLSLLKLGRTLEATGHADLLQKRGTVRFDTPSGALWAGDAWMGEVAVGSKEFFFVECLARDLDSFVPYADIRRYVLEQSGSTDSTEEATFCQGLKSRIKKKWVPQIDRLIATTNKGDGYRLRGHAEMM